MCTISWNSAVRGLNFFLSKFSTYTQTVMLRPLYVNSVSEYAYLMLISASPCVSIDSFLCGIHSAVEMTLDTFH